MKKYWKQDLRLWANAIGIGIFLYIVWKANPRELMQQLKGIDVILFLGANGVFVLADSVKAFRWHRIVTFGGGHSTIQESWKIYNIGIYLGLITPGKLGEFGRAHYAQKQGVPMKMALWMVIYDRLYDIFIIGMFSVGSFIYLYRIAIPSVWMIAIGVFFIVLIGIILWLNIKRYCWKIRCGSSFFVIENMLLTTISWILYGMWCVLVARSLQITLDPWTIAASSIVAGLMSLLPIAPSGLGTRDATLVYLLAPRGIPESIIIGYSTSMFISIILTSLIGAWFWWHE